MSVLITVFSTTMTNGCNPKWVSLLWMSTETRVYAKPRVNYIRFLFKEAGKWLVPCTDQESIWFLLNSAIQLVSSYSFNDKALSLKESDETNCVAAISGMKLPNPYSPALSSKASDWPCAWWIIFHLSLQLLSYRWIIASFSLL